MVSTFERYFGKRWPVPVAKPMAPFFIAGIAVWFGVNSIQKLMMDSDEFRNDPRNPNSKAKVGDKH